MERASYIAGLRALADFYDAHPEVNIYEVYCNKPESLHRNFANMTPEEFRTAARALGSFEKRYESKDVIIRKELASGFWLQFETPRDRVCKKVTKVVPAHTVEVAEETVEEWECEPLMLDPTPAEAPAE